MHALEPIITTHGIFLPDRSGLYHYTATDREIRLSEAIKDALAEGRPIPAWFWHQRTFCPIFIDDDEATLRDRWEEWRDAFENDPASLLSMLDELSQQI